MWYTIIYVNFNPFYMPKHQFSRLLSQLGNGLMNTPKCLSFVPWPPKKIFFQWICSVFSVNMQCFNRLFAHGASCVYTHSDLSCSFLPEHLSRISLSCCSHLAYFNCKVLHALACTLLSTPNTLRYGTYTTMLSNNSGSTNGSCSSVLGMTITSNVLYIPLPSLFPTPHLTIVSMASHKLR